MRHLLVITVAACAGLRLLAAADNPSRLDRLVRDAMSQPAPAVTGDDKMVVQKLFAFVVTNATRTADLPDTETLIALSADGTIEREVSGTRSEVAFDLSFDEPLLHAGSGIVLVHNHPSSAGLSGADLGQLGKPGVAAIVAIGNDGSIYAASAGPAFDADRFESDTYAGVASAVVHEMRIDSPDVRIPMTAFTPHVEHVAALALHKAGIVRYSARLGDRRRVAYDRIAIPCGHIAESVGRRAKGKRGPSKPH